MSKKSRVRVVEAFLKPVNGESNWFDLDTINEVLIDAGYKPDTGNGSTLFNDDRGLGKKYNLNKMYLDGSLYAVKLEGYKPQLNTRIPDHVRKYHTGDPCVICNTTHQIEIDHKDGIKKESDDVADFQPLCKHCNTRKREVCKKCRKTGMRFDATTLGFRVPVVSGYCVYTGSCYGCFWYDPIGFRNALTLDQ